MLLFRKITTLQYTTGVKCVVYKRIFFKSHDNFISIKLRLTSKLNYFIKVSILTTYIGIQNQRTYSLPYITIYDEILELLI